MSEDNKPDRLAMPSGAMLREIKWAQQFFRDNEPLIRQAQEAQRIFRDNEPLIRQAQQVAQAAERFARAGVWPVPPFQQQLMRTVEAALRGLQPAQIHAVAHPGTVDISVAGPTAIVASGSLAMPPMRISGEGTVQQPDLIERNIGRILALVLLAMVTAGLLGVQGPDRAAVDHYLTVLSFALPIAVLIWAGHK